MARSVPFSMRSNRIESRRSVSASMPGATKLPERHTCGVPTALGDTFPIRTIRPGKKDWSSLLKKHRPLETNRFILEDAAEPTKRRCKSAELTGTYAALVSNGVGGECRKSSQLASVAQR